MVDGSGVVGGGGGNADKGTAEEEDQLGVPDQDPLTGRGGKQIGLGWVISHNDCVTNCGTECTLGGGALVCVGFGFPNTMLGTFAWFFSVRSNADLAERSEPFPITTGGPNPELARVVVELCCSFETPAK